MAKDTAPSVASTERAVSIPDTEKNDRPAGPDPSSFPDGGLQAWLVVIGGFAATFASFGWINCE